LVEAIRLAPPIKKGILTESSFPMLCAIIMYPLCLKLLSDGLKKVQDEQPVHDKSLTSKKPLILAGITAIFILMFSYVGFVISALLFVFFFMLFFDDKPQQYLRKAIYSTAITAGVYVLYEIIFDVRFPELWR
jgi:putative tricarboxylic transport membrane protein